MVAHPLLFFRVFCTRCRNAYARPHGNRYLRVPSWPSPVMDIPHYLYVPTIAPCAALAHQVLTTGDYVTEQRLGILATAG